MSSIIKAPPESCSSGGKVFSPHSNDILCGRGGNINSHEGNVTFRQWIQERRESYNLAASKSDKTRVTNEILQRIRDLNPPGRFLQKVHVKDRSSEWWVVVDDFKALAKISQALREGAPAFKAKHGKASVSKLQRSSHSRRNSMPTLKKKRESEHRTNSARHTLVSPTITSSNQRQNMPNELDLGPTCLSDDLASLANIQIDFDTIFDHNNNGILKSSNSHEIFEPEIKHSFEPNTNPLLAMRDYHASLSDVANAVPPTPPSLKKQRVTSLSTNFLPTIETTSQTTSLVSPYSTKQTEHIDPFTFLSHTTPNNSGYWSIWTDSNHSNTERSKASRQSRIMVRGHSLSFSEGDMYDIGEFTNPFENDYLQEKQQNPNHVDKYQQLSSLYLLDSSSSMIREPLPSPHVPPLAHGLSFGRIGAIPKCNFLNSQKSSTSSFGDNAIELDNEPTESTTKNQIK